ncbi:MAG: KpsF/GutQ family sugar-phosphate isomerase [Phycisphaerales bacterium]
MNPVNQTTQTDPLPLARSVLEAEARAVMNVIGHLGESFARAVGKIAGCKGAVVVGGLGKSGIIGRKISATLSSTGTPSHFLHPTEAMHGDLGRIRNDDILLLLSYTGETEEVLALAALVRQDGVPTISMTGPAECHLARICDIALCIGDVTEACPHNLAPTASTTAMLALGDALALAVAGRRDFTADDFRKRHPGGSLGRQLMPVTQMMRFKVGVNLPLMRDDRTVQEVLTAACGTLPGVAKPQAAHDLTIRHAGAILLIDASGKLSGIFTDGDLRRLLAERGAEALSQPIAKVMTRSPRTLTDAAVVRDAVQLMRERRLDELPIVNDAGEPVGLIDVQDWVGMRVVEG